MSDIECPYCEYDQEINHDDGYGYEEDSMHEQYCGNCRKTFVYTTYISFYYEPFKADCLNGGDHKLKLSNTIPRWYSKINCEDCDYSTPPTDEQKKEFNIPEYEDK